MAEKNEKDVLSEKGPKQDEMELPQEPDELTPEGELEIKEKKIKNLVSAVILLAGLFVGSLFVDVIQMVRGGGFSQRALSSTDVFSSAGKTWVAFTDPIVKISVINDDSCGDACKPDDVLVGLKQALPTMLSQKVDVNSQQGQKLVSEFNIKTLPAFVFSSDIEKTDLFAKAQPFMTKAADGYAINSAQAGFPIGKYLTAPAVSDKDITLGDGNAKATVVVFGDFMNPSDKKAYANIISPMIKDYGDKIKLVFKNYFPQGAAQSQNAALASQCANAQGKFQAYADKLFANQAAWSKTKDTALMKSYAIQSGLNAADFNKCLDSKQMQNQITQDLKDGQDFALSATPSIFIGSDLQAQTATYDDVKKALDGQLNN